MTIVIELEGSNDLKKLIKSVNKEKEAAGKLDEINEFLLHCCPGDIVRVSITIRQKG